LFTEYNPDNLPEGLSEPVRAEAVALIKERDIPGAPDFTRTEHQVFGHHGSSKEIQIEARGEVVVYTDGGQLRITRRSAFNRRLRLLLESNPPGQPRPKIREVKTAFRKKARPRTLAELRGLAAGNAKRAAEAAQRRLEREAKTASGI
jgi:hypothetical protein